MMDQILLLAGLPLSSTLQVSSPPTRGSQVGKGTENMVSPTEAWNSHELHPQGDYVLLDPWGSQGTG